MAYNEAVNKRYTKQGQEDMTMKRYTEQELWAFVNRADTHEKIQIADKFLTKLDYLSIETYDAMMDALAYKSRELYHMGEDEAEEIEEIDFDDEDDFTSSYYGDYGPNNPWDAPGMSVRDFI